MFDTVCVLCGAELNENGDCPICDWALIQVESQGPSPEQYRTYRTQEQLDYARYEREQEAIYFGIRIA